MQNMRNIMPALQKAKPAAVASGIVYRAVAVPSQQRETRVVKDMPAGDIARELVEWIEA
jgi:electron transfer flavoprotein beta subunit